MNNFEIDIKTSLKLKELNIAEIEIHFSGGGDSGAIDYIEYKKETGEAIKVEDSKLIDAVETAAWKILDNIDRDWVNDDGGSGQLVINLKDQSANLELDIRYTQYESYSYSSEIEKITE
jgi:Fe-S cluster assembly iron-binding protein IscA